MLTKKINKKESGRERKGQQERVITSSLFFFFSIATASTTGVPTVNTTKTRVTISTHQTTKVMIAQTNSSSTITSETVIKQNITTPSPLITRPSSTHADSVIRETSTKVPRLTTETRANKDSIHEARNEKATSESVFVIVGVIASVIVIGCSAVAAGLCCYRKKW